MLQELTSKFNYDPACFDEDGNTILHTAAQHGQYKITEFLIANNGNQLPIDHRNCQGLTALHYACLCGYTRIVELMANKALGDKDEKALVDDYGNTLLHIAAQYGHYEIAKLLMADYGNQCPIDRRNSQGQTALHCACIGDHSRIAKFLVANKADITIRDEDGDTPLKKAHLTGHKHTLFELFDSNLHKINRRLLQQVCERGSVDLIDILLSDFNLDPCSVLDDQGNKAIHLAALKGYKSVIVLLVTKYKCPIDSRNLNGQTPLHLLCSQLPTENGHTLIRTCVSEFKADVTIKDNNGDQPIHAAVLAGYTRTLVNLISDHHVSPNSRGFKTRSLLHHALVKGHTSTAKTLIEDFHLSLHCVDEDGNTPLHLSSLSEQPESVRFLLHKYHAPVYVRNKAGKNALDLAMEDSTKKVIREYIMSEHKRIQLEYEELRAKSKQKYSGQQVITRVFVLGNSGSGKSTLIESLKRKGIISSLFTVTEADVPLHTAGIVPSVHQSKETGRLLYYDFAGDQEYYSSHAAILEMVSRSTVGRNVFLIVADLQKDDAILQSEIGYWLSFISYHGKALDGQWKLKVIVVLSHLDRLSVAVGDSDRKVDSARQQCQNIITQYNEVKFDFEIVSSNCRSPRSSKSIENILQQISKDTPPCSISYEASLLHGILEKDFGNVVACKFQRLLSNIEEIGIYLPSSADALHPIVRELHDIGLLMLIGRNEDELENYLLLLNPSSLTNEVHEKLFSSSAVKKLESSIGPHYANMGILPENYIASILPEHITKECLVQLQYCQEFNHAEVGLDYSVTSDNASDCNLLYFPALCKLDSKKSSWSYDPKFIFSIGWYAECTERFDYFPARFLHVLLLRLAYAFALPIINCNPTSSSNEISAYSRRCTMWKNGIHWRMEEGVEYIVEIVNDNKGIIVITKYKWNSEKWAAVLGKIIDKAMQAKAEFCNAVSLHHFVLKSKFDDTSSYSDPKNLFCIHDIERVIRQLRDDPDLEVLSADRGGSNSLDSHILHILKRYSCWGRL
jgi:ankyrin repeat protein/GTPase SAR1 family protein